MIEVAKPIEVTRLSREDLKKGTVLNAEKFVIKTEKEGKEH